jgi:hypothetical protein
MVLTINQKMKKMGGGISASISNQHIPIYIPVFTILKLNKISEKTEGNENVQSTELLAGGVTEVGTN